MRALVLIGVVLSLVAPSAAWATDSARVSGYVAAGSSSTPLDLVYGVHGYLKIAGHIDDGPSGPAGLQLDVRPFADETGTASCPGTEPAPVGGFDNNIAVGNDFDQGFASGVWTVGHRVLMCFWFHHHDSSVTQTSEVLTFRDPVDTIVLTPPASIAAVPAGQSGSMVIKVAGESDHQYAGQLRIQPGSSACASRFSDTSTIPAGAPTAVGDIANPGDQRFYEAYYAGLNPAGINVNLGAVASTPGTYRVCAWIGPSADAPAFSTSSTFAVTGSAQQSGANRPSANGSFAFFGKSKKAKVTKGAFAAGSASCNGACSIKATASAGGRTVARGSRTLRSAGRATLKLRLTKAAARRLRERRHLTVRVTVTVTPTGGAPKTSVRTLTLR